MSLTTLAHSADLGDIIASLPILRAMGGGNIIIGPPLHHQGRESLKGKRFDSLRPLLESQPYVNTVQWQDEPKDFTHDLRNFRSDERRGESLLDWQSRMLRVKTSPAPWLRAFRSQNSIGRPVIARSERYHNRLFPWKEVLKTYPRPLFVGTEKEYNMFTRDVGAAEYHPTENLIDLAEVIAGASVFIGNQSCPFWIAAGLGVPLIQEMWPHSPNSVVERPNARYVLRGPINQPERQVAPLKIEAPAEAPRQPEPENTPPPARHEKGVPMICALSFCEHDRKMAMELVMHMACLGNAHRHSIVLVHPSNVDSEDMQDILRPIFSSVKCLSYVARLRGWPDGANQAFCETAAYMESLKGDQPWLWIEPDCVMTRAEWLDEISGEYAYWGKPILGTLNNTFGGNNKITGKNVDGVGVFPPNFWSLCPVLKSLVSATEHYRRSNSTPPSFDSYISAYTVKLCAVASSIAHYWKSHSYVEVDGQVTCGYQIHHGRAPEVNMDAALIHGCRDFSLMDIVQRRLGGILA